MLARHAVPGSSARETRSRGPRSPRAFQASASRTNGRSDPDQKSPAASPRRWLFADEKRDSWARTKSICATQAANRRSQRFSSTAQQRVFEPRARAPSPRRRHAARTRARSTHWTPRYGGHAAVKPSRIDDEAPRRSLVPRQVRGLGEVGRVVMAPEAPTETRVARRARDSGSRASGRTRAARRARRRGSGSTASAQDPARARTCARTGEPDRPGARRPSGPGAPSPPETPGRSLPDPAPARRSPSAMQRGIRRVAPAAPADSERFGLRGRPATGGLRDARPLRPGSSSEAARASRRGRSSRGGGRLTDRLDSCQLSAHQAVNLAEPGRRGHGCMWPWPSQGREAIRYSRTPG